MGGGGRIWVIIQEFKCACGVNDWHILDIPICCKFAFFGQLGNLLVIPCLLRSGLWLFISFASHIAFLHNVAVLFFQSAWVAHRCKNGRLLG